MSLLGDRVTKYLSPTRLVFVALVALSLALFSHVRDAEAATATWNIYPGFSVSGIYDYGWHFDEGAAQFGARDYNFANDQNANVVFSAKLTQNALYPMRWRFDSVSQSCTVVVVAQVYYALQWLDVSGTEMHYKHLVDRVANGTVTSTVQNNGSSLFYFLGHAGDCNIDTGAFHVHQSADLSSSSKLLRAWYTDDTCWSAGSYTYQCPGGHFQLDDQSYTCPPGQWNSQYGAVSGPIPRYRCETWSQRNQNYANRTFYGVWP